MSTHEINMKINQLPEHLMPALVDYIDFLLTKYGSKEVERDHKFKFDWEGGLSELKDQYNSVELQHKAMDWR